VKKNNLKVVKIDRKKSLFNYEKKVLIKDLVLDLKLGYDDFEKKKTQKVKFTLEVNYENKKPSNDKDLKSIVNYAKITLQIEKLEIMKDCSSVGIQISKKRSHDKL
jgi:dihydroneopterin aldolase